MSISDWSKNKVYKKFTNTGSYNPADFSPSNNTQKEYKKLDLVSRIDQLIDEISSSYKSTPSYAEIEKVLRASLSEITELRATVRNLSLQLEDATEDIIAIHIGDETAIIDGDLASSVYRKAVSDYIIRAVENAVAFSDFAQNFVKESTTTDE